MAIRSKSIYLVLGAAVVFGAVAVYFWVVVRSSREQTPKPNPAAQVPKGPPEPPPAAAPKDPGERILDGADGAFKAGYYETALMFYKDYDLRYAGSASYADRAPRIWELIRTSSTMSGKPDPALPAYLEERKRLHEEWQKLPAGAGDEVRKYLEALPPKDGRRAPLEERFAEKK